MSGLSPQYILSQSLCRRPHCFAAHVPGQGYVNRGESLADDCADYWRQYRQTATSELENLGWAPAYADSGYEQPRRGVLMANWNHFPEDAVTLLERAGYALEWRDEWSTCGDCGRAVRTEPDGYAWEPAYVISEGDYLCRECAPEPEDEDEDADEDEDDTDTDEVNS